MTNERDDAVRSVVAELMLASGRPFGSDAGQDSALVSLWVRTLSDCSPDEIRNAAGRYVREDTKGKFPAPGVIRRLAFEVRARRRAMFERNQEKSRMEGPMLFCARCSARDLYVAPNGRFAPLHADNCPGLHPDDAAELQWAHQNAAIWRAGMSPRQRLEMIRDGAAEGPQPIADLVPQLTP
jgi:hypothetical protein